MNSVMETEVFGVIYLCEQAICHDQGTKTPTLGAHIYLALKSMTEPADGVIYMDHRM